MYVYVCMCMYERERERDWILREEVKCIGVIAYGYYEKPQYHVCSDWGSFIFWSLNYNMLLDHREHRLKCIHTLKSKQKWGKVLKSINNKRIVEGNFLSHQKMVCKFVHYLYALNKCIFMDEHLIQ